MTERQGLTTHSKVSPLRSQLTLQDKENKNLNLYIELYKSGPWSMTSDRVLGSRASASCKRQQVQKLSESSLIGQVCRCFSRLSSGLPLSTGSWRGAGRRPVRLVGRSARRAEPFFFSRLWENSFERLCFSLPRASHKLGSI